MYIFHLNVKESNEAIQVLQISEKIRPKDCSGKVRKRRVGQKPPVPVATQGWSVPVQLEMHAWGDVEPIKPGRGTVPQQAGKANETPNC